MAGAEHDDFELLIEKRIRGEESPDERSRLEAHLAACDRCRSILDEALRTLRAAQARLKETEESTNWSTFERHLNAEIDVLRSTARLHAWVALLGPAFSAITLAWLAPVLGWRWIAALAGAEAVVVGLAVLWLHMRVRARHRELASGLANLDTLWPAELRRRRRAGRLHAMFVTAYFALIAAAPLVHPPLWPILFFLFNPFLALPLISPELRRRRSLYERGLIDKATYRSGEPIRPIDAELTP